MYSYLCFVSSEKILHFLYNLNTWNIICKYATSEVYKILVRFEEEEEDVKTIFKLIENNWES